MNVSDYLSDDGLALLALCSAFALPEGAAAGRAAPLTPAEWNKLGRKTTTAAQTARRSGYCAADVLAGVGHSAGRRGTHVQLLERSGRLALELEGLFSRGLWAVSRADGLYPKKLRDTLKHQAPTVPPAQAFLLGRGGVAVIGSRNIDEAGTAFAEAVGRKIAAARLPVISGGARGTDRLAMSAALEAGRLAVGVLADSLERTVRQPDLRQMLLDGQLALLTPYAPTAGFSVGAAMAVTRLSTGWRISRWW